MSKGVWGSTGAGRQKVPTPDAEVARLMAEHNAVASIGQLRRCGLDDSAIARRKRDGRLHVVYRGVYSVLPPEALTLKGRLSAAVLACGDCAVLSHWSAGAWWRLVTWDDDGRYPEVTVPNDRGRQIKGIHPHRTRGLDERDVWTREGIRITSPARTVLDLATLTTPKALRRIVRQAQVEGTVSVRQLQDVADRANGHHGRAALQALIADGPTPTRSPGEDEMLDLVTEAGLPRPQVNPRLYLDGERIIPDFLWREHMLVVEVDGKRAHNNRQSKEDDVRKQAILEAHGYRVIRVTYKQLTEQPEQTLARIRAALAHARGR